LSISARETDAASAPHAALNSSTPTRRSLLHYAPAMVLLLIVVADSAQLPDPDLWGHLRFGQAALASGHVIARDSYSYSAAGGVWRNHEWLTEIIMALFYNGLGVVGLKLWKFACVATTMLLMALGMAETGASPTIQMNTLGLAALAMVPQNQFRPQLFSFMLLAATLALLARDNYRGRAPLWLLIPLMMLWGNLHGGFIIGIATLATYTGVVAVQDLIARRGLARALRLGLITLAGTLATLISPYGIDAWLVVWKALRHYAAQPIIADWQPLLASIALGWRTNPADTIFFICGALVMLAFAIAFIRTPRGADLPLAVIAAMLSVAAFTAVRNMPLAMVACAAPLARHMELLMAHRRDRKLVQSPAGAPADLPATPGDRSGANPWLAVSIAIMLALIGGLFSTHILVGSDSPVAAVAFMRQHDLHGNILSNFASGEYLIWHTAPASRVFIDGRYDTVYPQNVIDQYIDFINGRPNAPKVLQGYPHDFVMIPADSPALGATRSAAQWKLIYRDRHWLLFVRADSAAAKLPGIPIEGMPPLKSYFP
jgi:hypothetical protein